MKASDFEIGIIKQEKEGYRPKWQGYLIYKGAPVFEVIGDHIRGKDDTKSDFIPLDFVSEEGAPEPDPSERKDPDIGMLWFNYVKQTNSYTLKGTISLFDKTLVFPVDGWLATRQTNGFATKAVRLSVDSYYTKDEYFAKLAESGKSMPDFKYENNLDYTDEDLELLHQSYPEFAQFYKDYIQSQKREKVTTTKKFILPKMIPTMTQVVERAKVTSGVEPHMEDVAPF